MVISVFGKHQLGLICGHGSADQMIQSLDLCSQALGTEGFMGRQRQEGRVEQLLGLLMNHFLWSLYDHAPKVTQTRAKLRLR